MASNNHRKRRSHLSNPVETENEASAISASVTYDSPNLSPSPTKKPKRSLSSSSNRKAARSKHGSYCCLGLRRILAGDNNDSGTKTAPLQQHEQLGSIIPLCPKMYLGRTPPSMLNAMSSHKLLEATWQQQDFSIFHQKHQHLARKHAMLGLNREPSLSKTEDESLRSISRKLLQVVAENKGDASITLQRCPESRKEDGRLAQQTPVVIHRKSLSPKLRRVTGIENENENNSNSSRNSNDISISNSNATRNTNGSTNSIKPNSGSDVFHVQPNGKVVLKEGDILMILDKNYQYRVIRMEPRTRNPRGEGTATTKNAQILSSDAIDLTEISSSGGAFGRRPRGRSSFGGRESMSSTNDRTIALPNANDNEDGDGDGRFDKDTRSAIRLSLEESRKHKAKSNQQEIIQVLSSSEDDNHKQRSRTKEIIDLAQTEAKPSPKFTTPETLNLAESSRSASRISHDAKIARTNKNDGPKNGRRGSTDKPSSHRHNTRTSGRRPRAPYASIVNANAMEKKNQPVAIPNNPSIESTASANKHNNPEIADANANKKDGNDEDTKTCNTSILNSSHRHNTRSSRRQPVVPGSNNGSEQSSTTNTSKKTKQRGTIGGQKKTTDSGLSNLLRQKGVRIKTVLLREGNTDGILTERPIHEAIRTNQTLPEEQVKKESREASHKAVAKRAPRTKQKAPSKQQVKKEPRKAPKCPVAEIGPILSLESPTERFWDPLWSRDIGSGDPDYVTPTGNDNQNRTKDTDGIESSTNIHPPSALVSPLPPPGDTPASLSTFYWNALNSSRPREGAWYLNATIVAANTVPGPLLCQKWMALLTWGPKLITKVHAIRKKATERNFSWDGPRMDFALDLWKKALGLHPLILLPRMIDGAPGGPTEWWKTCIGYDELSEDEDQNDDRNARQSSEDNLGAEAAQTAIRCLRMRSARLEAFLHLLKSNLAFEKEEHDKLKIQRGHDNTNQNNPLIQDKEGDADDLDKDDDYSSDEGEENENENLESNHCHKCLVFLREIRSFGAKPALRLVAQAMSKFWVSQRNYLGYSGDTDTTMTLLGREEQDPHNWAEHWSLEQERSEIVEEMANQLAEVLCVMRTILEPPCNTANLDAAPSAVSRRSSRRRGRSSESSKLSNSEICDILWNSMDLEVRERLPKGKPKYLVGGSSYEEPEPRDAFLVDWVWVLQESMGNEFAAELAEKVGVDAYYEDLWEL